MNIITITDDSKDERLDKYLVGEYPELSRSRIQNAILSGKEVLLNGKTTKPNHRLKVGDVIEISFKEPEPLVIEAQDIPLTIVYEDDDVLVVDKPKGMVVHPAPGHERDTLVNAIMHHCGDSLSGINGVLRPGIVHRIDKDTTGLLVVCKNDKAHQSLADQLAVHSIKRVYAGICCGNIKNGKSYGADTVTSLNLSETKADVHRDDDSFSYVEGTINQPIGRNPKDRKKMAVNGVAARRAVTHYRVEEHLGNFCYCEFRLETGRTHQIRVHMASIGHPLLGDEVYGAKSLSSKYHLEGQCLHAKILGFIHPTTSKYMEFESPLPEYFNHMLEILRRH